MKIPFRDLSRRDKVVCVMALALLIASLTLAATVGFVGTLFLVEELGFPGLVIGLAWSTIFIVGVAWFFDVEELFRE